MSGRPPFVLVHGGRHGGWAWEPVARRLRTAGHDVVTPTLTGLGERSHLLTPDIGIGTHIDDVVNVFLWEDLHDVVLVAHSYGGMPVCPAMERIGDRVRSLVLLDAHLPRTGQSMFDIVGPASEARSRRLADESGDGWAIAVSDITAWGLERPEDIAWVSSRITPQPLRTYAEPVPSTERAVVGPYTYIECTRSGMPESELAWVRSRADEVAGRRHRLLEGPHEVIVTDPDGVTAALLDCVDVPVVPQTVAHAAS